MHICAKDSIVVDSIVVDSIAGFHLDENAPDIYVLHNNTAAGAINYGMPQANSTETFAVVNTGTGSLQGAIASTDETTFGLSAKEFAINASDTAYIDVTYLFNEQSLGIHQGAVTFAPTSPVLYPLIYPLTAYSTYADAWTEDFEPEYLREDETQPIALPAGWETTGWEVKLPSSGGGLMDMLGGLMGGGGDAAPKSWMANSFEDWYFEDKFTPVGKWKANFRSISDVEADTMNIYGLRDDGSWARFQSENGTEKSCMKPFRGYLDLGVLGDSPAEARLRAAAKPGTYKTMFQVSDQLGTSTGENVNYDNLNYDGDIPYINDSSTGIEPTIRAIDTDGTSLYFDLQGRLLNGKPVKGLYIMNGKKVISN